MEKIKLEILGLSSSQAEVGHFALVLGEVNGNRRLPIIIDGYQARAIALEIENIKSTRPMTHDLVVALSRAFDIDLLEVVITELKDGIFYAKLIFEQNGQIREIDSRTSDAVAIGVRFKVPLYTFEAVMSVAGIEVKESDDDEDSDELEEDETEETVKEVTSKSEPEELSLPEKIRRLQEKMQEAIGAEDYEKAARLRDEITRLEESGN